LTKLVADLALISPFFKKNLTITRRKFSDILFRLPKGICTNLPASSKQQKRILASLATGGTDIVVGTHRLLQPDVKPKNLRLMMVDEE
jgi:RecG-like helicase